MELTLESGKVIGKATEQDIRDYIVSEEFAILSVNDTTFIQCCRQKEPPYLYLLEYQDGSIDEHYQTADGPVTSEQAVSTFVMYLTGDESWRSDFHWKNIAGEIREESVRNEKTQRQGRMADWLVMALVLGMVAFIVLLFVVAK